jgi:hypothetical protein
MLQLGRHGHAGLAFLAVGFLELIDDLLAAGVGRVAGGGAASFFALPVPR